MTNAAITTVLAKEGQDDNVERLLGQYLVLSRAESGVVSYDAYRATKNPRQFLVVGVFRDEEAREAHRNSAHVKRIVGDQIMPLTEPFNVMRYSPIDIPTAP